MLTAYTAARERAAFLDRSSRGRIFLSGRDRASYLQGLLTNDIAALRPGSGCYAAYLTAQGRMIADMFLYEIGDVMLMTVQSDVKDTVLARLDQFIFSEDVQLADATVTHAQLGIVGPDWVGVAAHILDPATADGVRSLTEHGNLRGSLGGTPVIVTRTSDVGEPGFDLFLAAGDRDQALDVIRATGVPELDDRSAETLRIEAGIPRFHRDMDEETIPLEAGIESRAISFTKGCYVGQEVIIRVLHRGHGRIARRLVGVRLDGTVVPPRGARVHGGGKDIGHVTSAAWSERLNRPIALAYVARDFVEPGTAITIDGAPGTVTAVPFA